MEWIGTSDFTQGRKSYDFIVIHWSVTSNIEQVDSEVLNPNRQMSYHYALDNDVVHQFVKEENTAWHAGVWDINQRSIGVCIVAGPDNPYTEQDYITCAKLVKEILSRHPDMQIKGHRDFKATECPGNFDFNKLNNLIKEPMIGKLYNEPDGRVFISFDGKKFYVGNPDSIAGLPIENGTAPGEEMVNRSDLDNLRNEMNNLVNNLRKDIDNLTRDKNALQTIVEANKGTIDGLNKEIETLKKTKNELMAKVGELSKPVPTPEPPALTLGDHLKAIWSIIWNRSKDLKE